jgi:hypothetical protein
VTAMLSRGGAAAALAVFLRDGRPVGFRFRPPGGQLPTRAEERRMQFALIGGEGWWTEGITTMTAEDTTTLRSALEAELRRLRQGTPVGRRITALEVLLSDNGTAGTTPDTLTTGRPVVAPAPAPVEQFGRRGPGVSQAKLRAVRQYMETNGEVRQVDVSCDLGENSGSVSLALRALEAQGDVEDTGRVEAKSKVWRFIGEQSEAPAAQPADRIDVGNEVRGERGGGGLPGRSGTTARAPSA